MLAVTTGEHIRGPGDVYAEGPVKRNQEDDECFAEAYRSVERRELSDFPLLRPRLTLSVDHPLKLVVVELRNRGQLQLSFA